MGQVELANRRNCSMTLTDPSVVLMNVTVNDTNEYDLLCTDEKGKKWNYTFSLNVTQGVRVNSL